MLTFGVTGQSSGARENAVTLLIAEAAVGIAVLAAVITVLAILVSFIDESYRQVLERAPLGIRGAMAPFVTVAAGSGFATAGGLVGVALWGAIDDAWAQAAILAAVTGLTCWAVFGTVMLVSIAIDHGKNRAAIRRAIAQARDELERRRRGRQP